MSDNPWDTISWITQHLALSSRVPAGDVQMILGSAITTIISIGESRAAEGGRWRTVAFPDSSAESMSDARIAEIIAAIGEGVARGNTLVHCTAGASRSAGLVALYVAVDRGISWREALALVKERRPVVSVETPVRQRLLEWLGKRQPAGRSEVKI